jgi:hypothetical protein
VRRQFSVVIAIFGLALAGCTSPGTSSSPPRGSQPGIGSPDKGTVQGIFNGLGVKPGGPGRPSAGDLIFTREGTTYSTAASGNGTFSISLPPGAYRIAGWDVGETHQGTTSCQAVVNVMPRITAQVTVNCTFH